MLNFLRGLLLTGVPIFLLVAATEFWWRRRREHHELARKFIHMTAGTYAAFWPWFLGWGVIELLALGALLALLVSRQLNIFKSMHLARRYGTGEFLATISVGLLPFITHDRWIFAAAILQMSLADGLAAVIGTYFGVSNRYKVFGHIKSIAGTATFFIISLMIFVLYSAQSGTSLPLIAMLGLAASMTLIENLAVYGLDNLLVPVLVAVILMKL